MEHTSTFDLKMTEKKVEILRGKSALNSLLFILRQKHLAVFELWICRQKLSPLCYRGRLPNMVI